MIEEVEYDDVKVGDDNEVNTEEDDGKIELPPYPSCVFELPEGDTSFDAVRFQGDMSDLNHRLRHKLFYVWMPQK